MDPYRTIMLTQKRSGFTGRYSRADMDRAQENIARHDWAREIFRAFQEAADWWVAKEDEELYGLVPPDNPRALLPGFENGCPLHGGARGAFATSLETPYRFQCTIGGEWWYNGAEVTNPTSGEKVLVYDYGPGWVAPRGFPRAHDIYYFTAAYREFLLGVLFSTPYSQLLPGAVVRPCILPLGVMYALTGERKYAHKAAVLINRLAECFPKYDGCYIQYAGDWTKKNRLGLTPAPHSHCIGIGNFSTSSDTRAIQGVATAFDFIFEALQADGELLDFFAAHGGADYRGSGQATWEDVVFNVQHHLFGAAVDGAQRIIDDSWGSDWIQDWLEVLACLARVMENDAMVRDVMERPKGYLEQFSNATWRDGKHWYGNAGYAPASLQAYCKMAEWLHGYRGPYSDGMPLDLYSDARLGFERMFDCSFDWAYDGTMPSLGDMGGGGRTALPTSAGEERETFGDPGIAALYGALRVPAFGDHCLTALSRRGDGGVDAAIGAFGASLDGLWALVHLGDLPNRARSAPAAPRSRIFHDMGLAYFHTSGSKRSERTHFSFKPLKGAPGHGHHEQLAVGIVRGGYDLTPDAGYPAAWQSPKVAGWLSDTLSHNTVYLDGRTHGLASGSLRSAYIGGKMQVATGDAGGQVHPSCSLYRRVLAVVDLGPGKCFAPDFFRVSGSVRREYVFHGLAGEQGEHFSLRGHDGEIGLGTLEPGSLAGPDVPFGSEPGYGFLKDVRRGTYDAALVADWQAEGPETAGLRLHLTGGARRELITARGEGPGVMGMSPWDTYLLARVEADAGPDTLFAGVMEPYGPNPHLEEVVAVDLEAEPFEAAGLRVVSGDRVDYLFSCLGGGRSRRAQLPEGVVEFDAEFSWIAFVDGRPVDGLLINGSELRCGDFSLSGPGPAHGVVEAVEREGPALTVRWETPMSRQLPGPYLVVDSDGYSISSSYEPGQVDELSGDSALVELRAPELLEIGRATVERIEGRRLHLAQMLTKGMIRGLYDGKAVRGDDGGCGLIEQADDLSILLAEGVESFSVGESMVIDDVKVGDRVTVPSVVRGA